MSVIAVRMDRRRKLIMVNGSFPFSDIDAMNVYCDDAHEVCVSCPVRRCFAIVISLENLK